MLRPAVYHRQAVIITCCHLMAMAPRHCNICLVSCNRHGTVSLWYEVLQLTHNQIPILANTSKRLANSLRNPPSGHCVPAMHHHHCSVHTPTFCCFQCLSCCGVHARSAPGMTSTQGRPSRAADTAALLRWHPPCKVCSK